MGVVRCEFHGLSGFALVCAHLHDAVTAQRPQDVAVVVDEHAAIAMVCTQCIGAFTNTMQTGDGIRVGFDGGTDDKLGPICPDCFDAWVGPDRLATLRRAYVDAVAIFESQITGPLRAVGLLRELEPTATATLPTLHDVRGKLSKDVAAAVVAYLQRGIPVIDVMEATPDPLDPSQCVPGGPSLMSDGRQWVWRLDLAYYVARYRIALPAEFVAQILAGASIFSEQHVLAQSVAVQAAYKRGRR